MQNWRSKTDRFYPNTNTDLISYFISSSSQDTLLWKLQHSPLTQQSIGRINYWAFNQIKQWMNKPWSTSSWKTQCKPNNIDRIFVVECKSLICTLWNHSGLGSTKFILYTRVKHSSAKQKTNIWKLDITNTSCEFFNTIGLQILPWFGKKPILLSPSYKSHKPKLNPASTGHCYQQKVTDQ